MVKSKIIKCGQADNIKICKVMKPEERLIAFYNLSRSMALVQEAGNRFRSGETRPARKVKPSVKK